MLTFWVCCKCEACSSPYSNKRGEIIRFRWRSSSFLWRTQADIYVVNPFVK